MMPDTTSDIESSAGRIQNNPESGLSLVELMVSLVISSLLTLGLIEIFTAHQATNKLLQGHDLLADSGQIAMELISRSLMRAGYQGCNSKRRLRDSITNVPYAFDLGQGMAGYNATEDTWMSNKGAIRNRDLARLTGMATSRLLPGADLVTVWFAGKKEYQVDTRTRPLTTGTEAILLDASKAEVDKEFKNNPVALISNCFTENTFLITKINRVSRQTELEHATGVTVAAAQNATSILAKGAGYGPGSLVSSVTSHTYFIALSDHLNQQNDAIYSLFRKDAAAGPVELIEGIEDLQLLYGLAEAGKGFAPTTYLDASQVPDFKDVVSVRVQLTANSVDPASSPGREGILRHTLMRTIRLRNHFIDHLVQAEEI